MTPRETHRSHAVPIHIPVYRDRPLLSVALIQSLYQFRAKLLPRPTFFQWG